MKKDIHPKYYKSAKVRCACGAVFEIGSTKELMETEICSQCHPFYTGKDKIIDTLGRVEKFKERLSKKKSPQKKSGKKKGKKDSTNTAAKKQNVKTKKQTK